MDLPHIGLRIRRKGCFRMSKVLWLACLCFSMTIFSGCGAEEKQMPTVTPEKKAELDQAHAEAVKNAGGAPAEAGK